jgi:PiT family inorganic phosphate transporter
VAATAFIALAVLFLAYSNGANDNFKGVATLFGSSTATYRAALAWATLTTFAGALVATRFAAGLVQAFSGKGLVPETLLLSAGYKVSVAFAAAVTVLLATRFGFPISTTHALTGALVGAGFVAAGKQLNLEALVKSFAVPLLVSPVLSCGLTAGIYSMRRTFGRGEVELFKSSQLTGINLQRWLDLAHFGAAGLVSFARGFNDTPKITGLLVGLASLDRRAGTLGVGIAMAIGGWLHSHRVARTMSEDITRMNPGQGFIGNAVTGAVVLLASPLGLPVSTTHVTCGSLFGIGLMTGQARWRVIASILTAWITTLPIAALLGALCFALARGL